MEPSSADMVIAESRAENSIDDARLVVASRLSTCSRPSTRSPAPGPSLGSGRVSA
jgi:hypothetical protein